MIIWTQIKGYEGIYIVSSMGQVASCERIVVDRNGKRKRIKERILKPGGGDYLSVQLSKNGVSRTHIMHRLVAEHFIDKPSFDYIVNHKNGNKKDNRACNLEWVTPSENNYHAYRTGLMNGDHKKKIILDYNTGVFYESTLEFSKLHCFTKQRVRNWLNGYGRNLMSNLSYV